MIDESNGNRETVRVRFPPEVLDRMDHSVRCGEYATRGELVGEAIRQAAQE